MVSLTSARSAALLALILVTSSSARGETKWFTSMAEAEKEAQRLDVPLLLHFYADWCGPCRGMERNVLHSADVNSRLGRAVVGVKVDADAHRDLVARYNIRALPSDVLLDPSGQLMQRSEGAQQRLEYAGWLDRGGQQYDQVKAVRIAAQSKPKVTPTDPAPAPAPGPGPLEIEPNNDGQPVVATEESDTRPMLAGYSPVTLAESRQWIAGSPEYAAKHDGQIYLLTSAEELAKFEATPKKFVPRLLGCDPVLLHEDDRAIEGSTEYGAFFDGDLFLFESAETRAKFKKTPYKYTRTRHVLRANEVVRRS